jgi:ribonuclease HI
VDRWSSSGDERLDIGSRHQESRHFTGGEILMVWAMEGADLDKISLPAEFEIMVAGKPHFLLYCGIVVNPMPPLPGGSQDPPRGGSKWHFVLESLESEERLEAIDSESEASPDRLALLALVRGLEALEQPSRVTLLTPNRYVSRGLRFGLNEWNENEYRWEHFGTWRPVRNADLWRRVHHALGFHDVLCRMAPEMNVAASEYEDIEITSLRKKAPYRPTSVAARSVSDRCLDSIRDIGNWLTGKPAHGLELAAT